MTSNRRAIVARHLSEQDDPINPRDAVDDRLALADRFGLSIGFHNCSQDDYLEMVRSYAAHYGLIIPEETLRQEALAWSIGRGSRSGRVAWQYIQDLAGRFGRGTRREGQRASDGRLFEEAAGLLVPRQQRLEPPAQGRVARAGAVEEPDAIAAVHDVVASVTDDEVDVGGAFATRYPDFSGEDIKVGAGLGLRYYTGIGAIRVDVATPLDPDPGDSRIAFYVGLGESF